MAGWRIRNGDVVESVVVDGADAGRHIDGTYLPIAKRNSESHSLVVVHVGAAHVLERQARLDRLGAVELLIDVSAGGDTPGSDKETGRHAPVGALLGDCGGAGPERRPCRAFSPRLSIGKIAPIAARLLAIGGRGVLEAAVGHAAVVCKKLLFADEVHGGVIVGEIVGHGLDGLLHTGGVSSFLKNHKAFTGVLLSGGEIRRGAAANSLQGTVYRDGVLSGILNSRDASYCIRMSLAYPLAPEGVVLAVGKSRGCIKSGQRKQTGIPAAGDNRDLSGSFCGSIHIAVMLRDSGMGVKAVDNVEESGINRGLLRKIGCAAAAENHNVNPVLPALSFRNIDHRNVGGFDLHACRISAGENRRKLHIVGMRNCAFSAAAKVAVPQNTNSNSHTRLLIGKNIGL